MNRRSFLRRSAGIAAVPMVLGGLPLRLMARDSDGAIAALAAAATDRVLVVIQLEGGNDGLNMVVPVEDAEYYTLRPALAVAKNEALPLAGEPLLRLHPTMGGVQRHFNEGRLAVVENLGYPNPTGSHFSGTEIWNTASPGPTTQSLGTGWLGRWLRRDFPTYPDVLPEHPPAIEIGATSSSLFSIPGGSISMSIADPEEFYTLVNGGPNVTDGAAPDTPAGREWTYIDEVNRQARTYADAVRAASRQANNQVAYPADNPLAEQLAIVARLVAGGLGTQVYKCTLRGFDTHGDQARRHPELLGWLGDAIAAFQDDLLALGVADRVVGMTYSEFGRRIFDNGSGTDHGTAAPHFVFGGRISGGKVYGGVPDLAGRDPYGNLRYKVTFQCFYASILAPHFGLDEAAVAQILPVNVCDAGERLPLYRAASVARTPHIARLLVTPNPVRNGSARVILPPTLSAAVRWHLLDAGGREVEAGSAEVAGEVLTVPCARLAAGRYLLEVESGRGAGGAAEIVVVR